MMEVSQEVMFIAVHSKDDASLVMSDDFFSNYSESESKILIKGLFTIAKDQLSKEYSEAKKNQDSLVEITRSTEYPDITISFNIGPNEEEYFVTLYFSDAFENVLEREALNYVLKIISEFEKQLGL